jgi:hypothetical protein
MARREMAEQSIHTGVQPSWRVVRKARILAAVGGVRLESFKKPAMGAPAQPCGNSKIQYQA